MHDGRIDPAEGWEAMGWPIGHALCVCSATEFTLEGVTDITLLGGANALAVETGAGQWEIVQAGAAALIAPGRYRLTRLLRGQRGTEGAMVSMVPSGARVVVLDTAVASLPISEADLGLPWNPLFVGWLMGWPIGHALCACSATEFTLWQRHMRGALSRLPMASGPWIWRPSDKAQNPAQMSLFEGMQP